MLKNITFIICFPEYKFVLEMRKFREAQRKKLRSLVIPL
jgi:hypothetical protein